MTPRRVLGRLWTLENGPDTLTCVIVAADVGEELRVMQTDDVYVSEQLADRPAVLRRAEQIRLEYESNGWLRILVPAAPRVGAATGRASDAD